MINDKATEYFSNEIEINKSYAPSYNTLLE